MGVVEVKHITVCAQGRRGISTLTLQLKRNKSAGNLTSFLNVNNQASEVRSPCLSTSSLLFKCFEMLKDIENKGQLLAVAFLSTGNK